MKMVRIEASAVMLMADNKIEVTDPMTMYVDTEKIGVISQATLLISSVPSIDQSMFVSRIANDTLIFAQSEVDKIVEAKNAS